MEPKILVATENAQVVIDGMVVAIKRWDATDAYEGGWRFGVRVYYCRGYGDEPEFEFRNREERDEFYNKCVEAFSQAFRRAVAQPQD